MATLFAFFLLSPYFVGALVVLCFVLSLLADKYPEPCIFFVVLLAALLTFHDSHAVAALIASPGLMIPGVVIYFGLGVAWSFVKWLFFLVDSKEELKEYLKSHPLGCDPATFWLPPKAKDNKRKLIAWTAYWPWSVLRFLFGDMLWRVANRLYQLLSRQYDAVASWVYRDVAPLPDPHLRAKTDD